MLYVCYLSTSISLPCSIHAVERNWTDSSDEDQTAISSGSELESSRGQEEDPGYRRYPSSGLSSSDSENEVELKAKLHEKV